ncbi:MAG: DinB family protein [Flavobacteriales bacterium]|nr:DinB family protein [Flavobacteriales bacterium]
MRNYASGKLLNDLEARLNDQLQRLNEWAGYPEQELVARPAPGKWSVVEIVEHMSLSSEHYLKGLQRAYADPRSRFVRAEQYKAGPLGEWSVRSMDPGVEGRIRMKMRTMDRFVPKADLDKPREVFQRFRGILNGFLALLPQAREMGIQGPRIVSTLGPVLKFRIGDALRFPVAHQQRHMLQIARTLEQLGGGGSPP